MPATPQPTMEQRLTLEVELDMLADERQSTCPREAALWRALLLASESNAKGKVKHSRFNGPAAVADHLLDLMAVELAEVGNIRKCHFPLEVAAFCLFVSMEWPVQLPRRAGGRHGN
mgnify:CR=1 FL=1